MLKESQASTKKATTSMTQSFFKMTTSVGKHLQSVGRKTKQLGQSLSLRLTAPITLMGGLAVKAFSDFDNAMIESTSIMQVTTAQAARMEAQALSLGTKGVKGPKELAESYFFLASAGLDAEQAIGALPVVQSFATAGAFDMALATDLLTDAQTALGMSSMDAGENMKNMTTISDSFVKANQIANTSVQQISEAMTADAAVSSRIFGQSLQETVAVLAAYASSGKKGAEAGNLYGRATRLLTKAQRENGAVFEKFGIKVIDKATGKYNSMIDIIGDMENAFKDMLPPQKAAALEQLGFAALAQKSITPLLGLSRAMKGYEVELLSAAGATKDVAEKQMKSFANQVKVFKNQLVAAGISIGKVIAPVLLKINKWLTTMLKKWEALPAATKKAWVAVGAGLAFIGPLTIALGGMLSTIGFITIGLGGLGTAFTVMGAKASAAWAAATLGVSLLVTGIVALGFHLFKNRSAFDGVIKKAKPLLDMFKETWVMIKERLLPPLLELGEALWSILGPALRFNLSILIKLLPAIASVATILAETLIVVITKAAQVVGFLVAGLENLFSFGDVDLGVNLPDPKKLGEDYAGDIFIGMENGLRVTKSALTGEEFIETALPEFNPSDALQRTIDYMNAVQQVVPPPITIPIRFTTVKFAGINSFESLQDIAEAEIRSAQEGRAELEVAGAAQAALPDKDKNFVFLEEIATTGNDQLTFFESVFGETDDLLTAE
jgi:TP901 family phage tail tape measure protein